MGMYDTVIVACPTCGDEYEFQSKSGNCELRVFFLDDCPEDILGDVNRHSPYGCDCGTVFEADIDTRTAVIVTSGLQ